MHDGRSDRGYRVLGLLEPQRGRLPVNGHDMQGEELRAWQQSIGYVPQSIFLRIFMLEQGRLVAEGRYEELLEDSAQFRAMASPTG